LGMRWPFLLITALAVSAVAQQPQTSPDPLLRPGTYRVGNGVSAPQVLSRSEPEYSEAARKANLEGTVGISFIVSIEGTAMDPQVTRSLGNGFDEKAIEALGKWRFQPGMKDGKPVPVQVNVEFNFRLLGAPSAPAGSNGSPSSPYVRDGSIGKAPADTPVNNWSQFRYLPLDEWQGKRVIFLPQPGLLRKYGYQSFKGGSGDLGQPTYAEAAGKIGKVIAIERSSERVLGSNVLIEIEGSGARYVGRVSGPLAGGAADTVDGIAFLDEIDQARQELIGKTLWILSSQLLTNDESSGRVGSVKVKKFSPVKVTDVVVGWRNYEPIRLILKSETGEEGFFDVSLSGTNASKQLVAYSHVDKHFSRTDPKSGLDWPKSVWDAIQDEKVALGMTKEQVTMSWGTPKSVAQTVTTAGKSEQWVYGNGAYVYFTGGLVSGIQNEK
jgi:TonB family protein